MHSFILTEHGLERARQRISWHTKTTERMIPRVFYKGLDLNQTPRRLQGYLAEKVDHQTHSFAKVYGELIFVFSPTKHVQEFKFVTVYQIPQMLRKYIHHGLRQHGKMQSL